MDPAAVQTLAENAHRLRRQALVLCQDSLTLLRQSEDRRVEGRERVRRHMEDRVRRAQSLREQFIARRLLTGRLPSASAAVLLGSPGTGGNCDGCDKPLTTAHLVMAIPAREQTVVHLHAACFMIWNAIRPHTGEGKIN